MVWKILSVLFLFVWSQFALGNTYYPGASLKSFINLDRLQNYELGVSSTFQDVFGKYDGAGSLTNAEEKQTYSLSFGVGGRLWNNLQSFLTVPFVLQKDRNEQHFNIGDAILGGKWIVGESLYYDKWYPAVLIFAGMKIPTGSRELFSEGKFIPGTGNGLWEPFIEVGLLKELKKVTLGFNANYTTTLSSPSPHQSGERFEVAGSFLFPFSEGRWNIGGGASHLWVFPTVQTTSRRTLLFLTSSHHLTREIQIIGSLNSSLPISGLGVNEEAVRTLSFTMKYGFF